MVNQIPHVDANDSNSPNEDDTELESNDCSVAAEESQASNQNPPKEEDTELGSNDHAGAVAFVAEELQTTPNE